MADRSVTVRLDADVKPFITALSKAEAAAKKFRDGLGKGMPDPFEPWDEEQQKRRKRAPKEGDEIAGAFARAFSRRLEAAFKNLPKAKVDTDASEAQQKLQEVRSSLQTLSGKQFNVDIDAASALTQLATLRMELDRLSTDADIDVRADTMAALAELQVLQREIDKLSEPVQPQIDIDPARQALADLQARMAELSGRTIGIDLDAGAAKAEIAAIERELQQLNASSTDIDIRLDTTKALADLRALESSLSSVSNRSARVSVSADVGSALASIALVGAALASLPAVTSIAVGVGALGGAFAAAGAGAAGFAAVAGPSLGRINEALKEQASAAGSAGGATKSAGQSAAEAASQALQLEQAERRVSDAQKGVRQAQEDLTRARRDAKRALEDYVLSVKGAALSEEDAALAVEEAGQRLAEVLADEDSDDLDIRRAELNHRLAMQRLDEQTVRTKRLKQDKAEADKKGVEGSDAVRAAQDKLLKSQADLAEAQKALTVLQLQQKAAMESAGGAAGGAASKMSQLSKAERELAEDIKKFQDRYLDWQRSLQPDVFPVIRSGMDLMTTGMKIGTPIIKASAGAFDDFLKQANKELKGDQWTSFFDDLADKAPRAIDGLTDSAMNIASGVRGIIEAFLPYTDRIMDFLEDSTQEFENWGENLKGSPELKEFLAYAAENGPKVAEIFGNVATFVGNIVEAGAGLGSGVLDFMVILSEELADMDPQQIEAIAKGVALIFAAVKLGASLKIGALVLLAQVIGDMSPGQIQALAVAIGLTIAAVKGYQAVSGAVGFFQNLSGSIDGAGKSADGAKGKLAALGGVFGKGGLIAAAVAGTALAMDSLGDAIYGLNPSLDKLSQGLSDFGKGGAPAEELLDQLGPKMTGLGSQMETFGDSAARLVSDNPFMVLGNQVAGFIDSFDLITLDNGKQSINNLDQALAAMASSGNGDQAAGAFNRLASQAVAAGTPVDRLRELFPKYAESLDGSIPRTGEMASAMSTLKVEVDPTVTAMQSLNESLDAYNAKTDTARLTLELRDAFKEAKDAIADAGGKLDFSSQMTDKQREAVIKAREQFIGYIEKVQAAATAAGEMAGKTGEAAAKSDEAKEAILRQLPQLGALAGKSGEARERVLKLAEAYGISRADADKAMRSAKDFQEVLDKFKNKNIYIKLGLDTSEAIAAFERFVKKVGDRSLAIALTAKQEMKARSGGIFAYEAGGLQKFAAGGRSTPPNMATGPTILYGEGADQEAFIPYEARYRERAIGLLSQVANDFGLQLNNQAAAQGLSDLTVTIDQSGLQIADGLTSVMGSLEATMGQAGSLTGSIAQVGSSADQLGEAWLAGSSVLGDTVSLLGATTADSTTAMAGSVDTLSEAIAAGQEVIKELLSGGSKGKAGSKAKGSSKSSAASLALSGAKGLLDKMGLDWPGGKSGGTSGGLIAGHDAVSAAQTIGESSLAAVPPHYSKMSAPQQMTSTPGLQQMVTEAVSAAITSTGGGGNSVTKNVNFYGGQTITKEADADVLFKQAALSLNSR
ncbi:hypothetical protein [Nonomuraea sp. NPDC050643]|uniref:hypothetical protein n=1 Tax=Nonomuraea sp. NPDC050643 TaxID=3155660 RepID=UPI0033DC22C8